MNELRCAAGTLGLDPAAPWLMGMVDPVEDAIERAGGCVAAGARLVGVRGGPACAELTARLREAVDVPLVAITADPAVAGDSIDAGAAIIDAAAGPVTPELVEVCAGRRGALVVPVGTPAVLTAGLPDGGWMFGTDTGRTAAPSDRPLLVRAAAPDMARELAAVARGLELEASILVVQQVAAALDYIAVHAVLTGRREVDPVLRLAPELRREPPRALAHPSS